MFKELEELKKDIEYHNKKYGYTPLMYEKRLEAMELGWKMAEEKYKVYLLKQELLNKVATEQEKDCTCQTCLVAREEIKEIVKLGNDIG